MKIQVGQTVRVDRTTDYKPNGASYLTGSRPSITTIVAVYLSGKVRTLSGDVWRIRPNPNTKESHWIIDEVLD